jgi:hypothetical protein
MVLLFSNFRDLFAKTNPKERHEYFSHQQKKKECICKWLALDKYHGTTKLQMHGMMMIHEQKEVILSCQGLWTSLSVSSNSLKSRICKTDTQTGLKIQP